MRKQIEAKYKSKCYECGEQIEVGEQIIWDILSDGSSAAWHLDCDCAPLKPMPCRGVGDNFWEYKP